MAAHLYLWHRLVRATTRPGRIRRWLTALTVVLAALVPLRHDGSPLDLWNLCVTKRTHYANVPCEALPEGTTLRRRASGARCPVRIPHSLKPDKSPGYADIMTTPGRSAARRKPPHALTSGPFRRLWTAMSIHGLGDWLSLVALTAVAGTLTAGSGYRAQALAVGGVLLAKLLPAVLLGPPAAALAGRFDRRLTMAGANLAMFALVLSVPLVGTYLWTIIAVVLLELAALLWAPAKDSAVASLVPKERLTSARSLNLLAAYGTAPVAAALFVVVAVATDLGRSLSPGFTARPTDVALLVNAAIYLASAACLLTLKIPPGQASAVPVPSILRQITAGWRHLAADRPVRGLIVGMLGAVAAVGAVVSVARTHIGPGALGGGDAAYGTLLGAVFLGMAFGLSLGPRTLRELSRGRLFGLSIISVGVLLAAAALIHNLVVVVLLTGALAACAGIAWSVGLSAVDAQAGDLGRGRTLSFLQAGARAALIVAVLVAAPLAGLFGHHVVRIAPDVVYRFDGANLVLLVCGLLSVVLGIVSLRHVEGRGGAPLATDLFEALRGRKPVAHSEDDDTGGLFIAFEGGEGSGKTTQSRLLAIWLRDQGFDVVQTREPGSTKVGMRLRAILLDAAHQGLSARSEALLYSADRAEHVEKVIRPALQRGALVVTDRYIDSSLAYQGAGRALDSSEVAKLNEWATGGLLPDLTVLIDVPPSIGLTRFASPADRIEAEPLEFHERVRREFRALAAAAPDRYLVVDGTLPQEEVSRIIQDHVREILPDPVPQESEDSTGTMPAIRD